MMWASRQAWTSPHPHLPTSFSLSWCHSAATVLTLCSWPTLLGLQFGGSSPTRGSLNLTFIPVVPCLPGHRQRTTFTHTAWMCWVLQEWWTVALPHKTDHMRNFECQASHLGTRSTLGPELLLGPPFKGNGPWWGGFLHSCVTSFKIGQNYHPQEVPNSLLWTSFLSSSLHIVGLLLYYARIYCFLLSHFP